MRVVLSGRYWKIVLDSGRDVVSAAVRQDIAVALGIQASYINILSLAPGSLVVEFEATDSLTDTIVGTAVGSSLSRMSLPVTQYVYLSVSGSNESVSVSRAEASVSSACVQRVGAYVLPFLAVVILFLFV